MREFLLPFLWLFDGGASAASAGAAAEGAAGNEGANGSTESGEKAPAAGENKNTTESPAETPEARKARFKELISGEFRDLYNDEMSRIVQKRLSKSNAELEGMRPIMGMLAQKYGMTDVDAGAIMRALEADEALWEQQAIDAGFPDVNSFVQYKKMQREVEAIREQQATEQGRMKAEAQVNDWLRQAEAMKGTYPAFDLQAEIDSNPKFISLLQSGIPVQHAYEVLHMDDVKAAVAQQSAADAEKRITDSIRAKGARPTEAGAAAGTAVGVKTDVHSLTAADRKKIAEMVKRGEKFSFN